MKIALLSYEYPPETGFGGIGTYTWYHARALARAGHEVHVLAGSVKETPLRTETHDGVTVFRYRAGGGLMRAFGYLDRHRLWWTKNRLETGLSMYRGLKALLERQAYDIVEMPECGGEGWLLTHLTDVRTVIRLHSPARLIMDFYDVSRADITFCSLVESLGMKGTRAFTSCSRFLANEAAEHLGIRSSIEVIHNGIDLTLFDGSPQVDVRKTYGIPEDRPVILFTGRMEPRKGITLCPDIVSQILERHAVAFVFAGRDLFGYMENTLLPAVRSRPLRGSMHYLGELSLQDVRSCVRQADIFFLPSVWENCPYSCLEAMAAGRTIVASDQGGLPELITDGVNGLLARSGDVSSFVGQLERVIEDAALRERLGSAARRTVEESFTDARIAELSLAYYRR